MFGLGLHLVFEGSKPLCFSILEIKISNFRGQVCGMAGSRGVLVAVFWWWCFFVVLLVLFLRCCCGGGVLLTSW